MSFLRRGPQDLREQFAFDTRSLQSNQELSSSTWFIAAIVALIVLFYLICVYQCIIIYCRKLCGREPLTPHAHGTATVLLHEGRVFNLTEDQRRAVLEAIYADNSKPATDLDVAPTRRKRRRQVFGKASTHGSDQGDTDGEDNETVPVDVEIPDIEKIGSLITQLAKEDLDVEHIDSYPDVELQVGTETSDLDESDYSDADDGHIDREFKRARSKTESSSSSTNQSTPRSTQSSSSPSITKNNPMSDDSGVLRDSGHDASPQKVLSLVQSDSALEPSIVVSMSGSREGTCDEIPLPERCESMDSWDNPGEQAPVALSLPDISARRTRDKHGKTDNEALTSMEEKQEESDAVDSGDEMLPAAPAEIIDNSTLQAASPLLRRESFTTQTSEYTYDDDSCTTGDNVCPICLCGYVMGDILIMSKHCSHVFHKECILEWLQKHDDCPVCRASMITETEMNRAATSLVGKTRMYRAVASMRTQNLYRSTSPSHRSPTAGQTNASPFSGTMRRSAFNYS